MKNYMFVNPPDFRLNARISDKKAIYLTNCQVNTHFSLYAFQFLTTPRMMVLRKWIWIEFKALLVVWMFAY